MSGSARSASPNRRELLIDRALDVVAEHGVSGTTHRRVAAAAGVPLGSTTYYFADLDDLLTAAFTRFADDISDRFEARLNPVQTPDQAVAAITEFLLHDMNDPREHALNYEFYAYAIRRPATRALVEGWFSRSQQALGRFFDPATARLLDTLIEGFLTYRGLAREPSDAAEIRAALLLLTSWT